MAYLIPNNLASHSGVRASVREVAALLRDHVTDEATIVGDPDDDLTPLWIIHPEAGAGVVHVIDGGKRTIMARAKEFLGRDASMAELYELGEQLSKDVNERIARSEHLDRNIEVRTILTIPGQERRRLERLNIPSDQALATDDLKPDRIEEALRLVLGLAEERRLTHKEEKAVRAAISPEIIIRDRLAEDGEASHRIAFRAPEVEDGEDPLAVLDREQQQLAKHMGDGYRVIRGVAGSGKSIVLAHRARHLATEDPERRILLTAYNIVISKALAAEFDGLDNVDVLHVDSLAYRVLSDQRMKRPDVDNWWEVQRELATDVLKSGKKSRYRYDAVLVDEAQDFDNPMLDLAFATLRGDDFVVALDSAQNIYRKRSRWSPPDQTARGRTTVLKTNYRNTKRILELAYEMLVRGAAEVGKGEGGLDGEDFVVAPEAAARLGDHPTVVSVSSAEREIDAVLDQLEKWHGDGVPWSDMLVLFGNKRRYQGKLYHRCRDRGIPYFCISFNGRNKKAAASVGDVVRSSTIQSVKGVEFGHVAIMGANDLVTGPKTDDDDVAKRRLLYVGMTRATDELFLPVSGEGDIGADLLELAR